MQATEQQETDSAFAEITVSEATFITFQCPGNQQIECWYVNGTLTIEGSEPLTLVQFNDKNRSLLVGLEGR